jgi:hypothetical protein
VVAALRRAVTEMREGAEGAWSACGSAVIRSRKESVTLDRCDAA